ncbi:MAG TPA: FAD-binding oxidoreductase [Gemmataceae bacterium]|nr:FAD-binding oxidoreductase [Gemmataceae bacterium]
MLRWRVAANQRYSLNPPLSIDGFGPLPVARPQSVADVGDLVRRAAADGTALYPVGGGTMLDYGLPPTKPGTAVDLRGLDRVIDYPARDMTITVQAGITISRLQDTLKAERQQLPVDVPFPDRATLGGAVATNASGPRRFGHGTLRDYVIGVTVVNDEGREVKGGGRVVKNVAGYDLMKLYTGSLGTLGIIAQLTLKVKPLSEAEAAIVAPCPPDVLETVLGRVLPKTATRPTVLSVANAPAAAQLGQETRQYSLVVGFEEKAATVDWQVSTLNQELAADLGKSSSEFRGDVAAGLVRRLSDFPLTNARGLTFKANLLPAGTAAFFRRADGLEPRPALVAHAGNGIVYGHLPGDLGADRAREILDDLGRMTAEWAGNVVVIRCPHEWKAVVPVWGRPTPDRLVMRAVKEKLDPSGMFNPGRFVDGI